MYSSISDVPQILQHLTRDQLMSCTDTAVAFTAPPCVSRNVLSQGVQVGMCNYLLINSHHTAIMGGRGKPLS